jgi:hypothetical protein
MRINNYNFKCKTEENVVFYKENYIYTSKRESGIKSKLNALNKVLSVFLLLLLCNFSVKAQLSPSGQAKIIVPSTLSACNHDTICLEITNLKGGKGVTYSGNTTIEVDIPGGSLVDYQAGSVSSVPAGATETGYAANKLTISVPLPGMGMSTKVCFIVRPDCNVANLSDLPFFTAKVTYPAGFPTAAETFDSGLMNVGQAVLSHLPYGGSANYADGAYFNAKPAFGGSFRVITEVKNNGYGNATELILTTIHDNNITLDPVSLLWVYRPDDGYPYTVVSPITTLPYNATQTIRTYKISSINMGADGKLGPGENLRFDEWLYAPSQCATYDSKVTLNYTCGAGQPTCAKADTLRPRISIAAGTPKLDVDPASVSAEDPDGCPDKLVKYKIRNSGVGNAAPTGNAYDIDLNINFGGGVLNIKNLTLNGVTVPAANLLPNLANSNNFKISLKDKMTTDPDGPGGISDIDGDGYFDDMLVAAETEVSFNYTMPCKEACGVSLYYNMGSNNTFTDFCRTLVGVTNTPLKEFGFKQVQPIEQKRKVDFGVLTTGQSKTDTAKFAFQYKALNVDFSQATVQLKISYRDKMELDPTSIRINGVAPTNAPVLQGSGDLFAGTAPNPLTDNDSTYVIDLTLAEINALFDNTPDSLKYVQTYYGCTNRQNTKTSDTWSLCVKMKPGLCADGSTPCTYDLACKKPWAYSSGNACGVKPCYITEMKYSRDKPVGYTDVTETTPIGAIDLKRAYGCDTVSLDINNFYNGDWFGEPVNYFNATIGRPDYDMRSYFGFTYSKPIGSKMGVSPWTFIPGYSVITVRKRIPNPADPNVPGTLGPIIFTAPLLLEDFQNAAGFTTSVTTNTVPSVGGIDIPYAAAPYSGRTQFEYICDVNPNSFNVICPTSNYYENSYSTQWYQRNYNKADNKINENYYLCWSKALGRGGFAANANDDDYYYEVKTKWKINQDFPFDNSNDFSFKGGMQHIGNLYPETGGITDTYSPTSSYTGSCNDAAETGLAVTKNHYISNPKAVYSASCGLRASNKVFFNSYDGNYFDNGTGEVRVPLKIDSIVVDIPTEYAVSNISLDYNQSCTVQTSTALTASVPTGHVVFKNGATDFPRADDCSGNKTAYDLSYDLTKAGSAAPTLYRLPIKIYTRDEFNKVKILIDTASISEDKPELVITPLTPVLQVTDGGACQPAYFDFKVQNNTLYDAPNSYFAAESTAGTIMSDITDGPNVYIDAIVAADKSVYGGANIFAKLGTIKAGDVRIVRVFAHTNICADAFTVHVDYGCTYPSPIEPNLASGTIKTSTASYEAVAPTILSRPIADISVMTLCDDKTIEIELKNAKNTNINKLLAEFILPANATYTAGTMQIKYPTAGTYTAIAAGDITQPTTSMLNVSLNNTNPFNTICGLVGADTATLNTIRVKFDINFTACPTKGVDAVRYKWVGENYCGKQTINRGTVPVYYLGSAGAQNNYSIAGNGKPIKICVEKNEIQAVKDTITIKNLGGFGANSGASSGKDSLLMTIPVDAATYSITNITLDAPFVGATLGTDAQGNITVRVLVPAGIAVNATSLLVLNYDLTPKVDKLCTTAGMPLCYFNQFSSPVLLECAAKGLSCGSLTQTLRGQGAVTHGFECCYGSIGNYVWMDVDNDGIQGTNAGETPVADLVVELYDATGTTLLQTTKTDASGKYVFDSLFTGGYKVKFAPVANSIPTKRYQGTDITLDNDMGADGFSQVVNIDNKKAVTDTLRNNPQIDAGFVPVGSIGDYVFLDADDSKTQSAGDTPIDGVKVYLLNAAGTIIDSTTTAGGGKYLFPNLVAGTYSVQFVAPAGESFVTKDTGADDLDSDAGTDGKTGTYVIDTTKPLGDPARDITTVDAGIKPPYGSIGDYVFLDVDDSKTQSAGDTPIDGVKVYLLNGAGTIIDSTTTAGGGKYLFPNLIAGTYSVQFVAPVGQTFVTKDTGADDLDSDAGTDGKTGTYTIDTTKPLGDPARDITSVDAGITPPLGSIGDYVFLDKDNSNTQSAGDTPIDGVKVYLLNAAGTIIDSTTTAGGGKYLFPNLVAGTYSVQFVAPAGQSFVTKDTGADDLDSDAGTDGKTGTYTIDTTKPVGDPARDITTVDAGIKDQFGSIGDAVFVDNNGDGKQDAGDTPLDGVKVYLLNNLGAIIDSTVTAGGGKYLFPNLVSGTYEVQFVAPSGETFVTPGLGGDPALDSNAGANGKTGPITINTALPAGDPGRDNLTVDAGICVKPNAGIDEVICQGNTANLTDATATQTWSAKAGNPSAATIDATTGVTSVLMAAGDYYFILTNTAGCIDEVKVTVNVGVTAGIAANVASECAAANMAVVDLASKLTGATAGGTWTNSSANAGAGFTAATGMFDPNGLAAGSYKFVYTVTGTSPCPNDTTEVLIRIKTCATPCNILDAGLTVYIDQKGTSSTADDEYVILANPTGSGLSGTYNVSGDITKTAVPYGVQTEIGRVSYGVSSVNIVIEDSADPNCSIADGAYNLNANTCLLTAGPTPYTTCNDNGTPADPSDDTYSVSINPSGVGTGTTYSVTGDIVKANQAYGTANVIATGLLISAGGKTISIIDDTKADCELLNIRIDAPAPCSTGVVCPPKICVPVKVTKN